MDEKQPTRVPAREQIAEPATPAAKKKPRKSKPDDSAAARERARQRSGQDD